MGRPSARWILLSLMTVSCGNAQQADTGGAIASLSAGGSFGLGAHGAVAGDVAAPVSTHFLPYVEFSYAPLSSYAYTYGENGTGKALFRSYLLDLDGGVKIRFPRKKSDWVPYIGFGAGVLHEWWNTHQSGFGTTLTTNQSRSDLAGNASVGGLYYITPRVGLQFEAKGYASQRERLGRATAGIFYQFQ